MVVGGGDNEEVCYLGTGAWRRHSVCGMMTEEEQQQVAGCRAKLGEAMKDVYVRWCAGAMAKTGCPRM